jgi:shikimate dehydrogenase
MAGPTRVSSHTRLYCLLGDPVSRSKSPAMMNAAFAAAGIDGVYLALRVGEPALGTVLNALKEVGCGGVNVTAPHKQAVIPFLDRLSGTAETNGSVNTIVFDGKSLVGHSTDGEGLVTALEQRLGESIRDKTILVFGAGGAARGVLPALLAGGAGDIVIANRSVARAEQLARELNDRHAAAAPLSPAGLSGVISRADIVINATALPVMSGTFCDIDLTAFRKGALVFDMNYGRDNASVSAILAPRAIGFSDGLTMLLFQGARSFSLWTNQDPPLSAMRSALGL